MKTVELRCFLSNEHICPVTTLRVYLDKTASVRAVTGSSQLLISFRKPHAPVSCDTIARWIKRALKLAGVDITVFSAHSARSACASAHSAAGVPVNDTLAKMGWSNAKTFHTFYHKKVV